MSPAPPRARRASPASARRRRPPSRRRGRKRSDLRARILAAIPGIAFAIFIIAQGGLVFALGAIALGLVCLHELYTLLADVRPVKLAGFLGLVALAFAALYGDQFQVVLVAAAIVPVLFAFTVLRPVRDQPTLAMSVTLLGVWWVGLAIAHAVLLREVNHGNAIIVDVLVGTFVGDTGAYIGGRLFGRRPLAPRISPTRRSRAWPSGLSSRSRRRGSPAPIRTGSEARRRCSWASGSRSPRPSETSSSPSSSATSRSRTPAGCSEPTAAR